MQEGFGIENYGKNGDKKEKFQLRGYQQIVFIPLGSILAFKILTPSPFPP